MLGEALGAVSRTRSDLGYRPKTYWSRFPHPLQTPYVAPFFVDLFAEPLEIPGFTARLGEAAAAYLPAAYRDDHDDAGARLLYHLGLATRAVGMRGYGANLAPMDTTATPLVDALRRTFTSGGAPIDAGVFGEAARWPANDPDVANAIASVPEDVALVVAGLVHGLCDAHGWWKTAFRNVPVALRAKVARIRRLGETQPDGIVFHSELSDLAERLDEPSLDYAALKAIAALERARAELDSVRSHGGLDGLDTLRVEIPTPLGRVIIRGTGNDRISGEAFCIVDLGGDDRYEGGVGASSFDVPIAVLLDAGGNDEYVTETEDVASQGAGVVGVGIVWEVSGDDSYTARNVAQGAAICGVGVLVDESGRDAYSATVTAQGAGFFGIGLCLEGGGDDSYDLDGDGQGFGGPAGTGVLADVAGNDSYYCEPYAEKVGRADYHSDFLVAASHAQGVGSGRRGDGGDGHAWAGGLGALLDIAGDDRYEAGNWSQGTGYWFGTGLIYEGGGDDTYRSVYFTQASGAHFAIGAIVDVTGDDTHELFENAGAGLGFGWDFTHALLLDGSGNDAYTGKIISLGLSEIRSNAFLVDLRGDDTYRLDAGQLGFGASDHRDDYREPTFRSPYMAMASSFGFLLDGGGRDRYLVRDRETDAVTPHARAGNDRIWLTPEPESEEWGAESFGVGLDAENGTVPEWSRIFTPPDPGSP